MFRYACAVIAMAIALPAGFAFSQSHSNSSCLVLARQRIRSGDWITLRYANHKSLQGRLVEIDSTASSMTLAQWETTGVVKQTFQSSEIVQIAYRKSGKLRPLYPILGFLIGSVAGQLAENYIIDPGSQYKYGLFGHNYTHRGSFWGGLSGAAVGITLSLLIPSKHVLKCR